MSNILKINDENIFLFIHIFEDLVQGNLHMKISQIISNYIKEPSWISSMSMKNGHSYMMMLTMMLAMILAVMLQKHYKISIKRIIKHKD